MFASPTAISLENSAVGPISTPATDLASFSPSCCFPSQDSNYGSHPWEAQDPVSTISGAIVNGDSTQVAVGQDVPEISVKNCPSDCGKISYNN